MQKLEHRIVAVNRGIVAALLVVTFAIVLMNVVGRYSFGVSFSWVEETARYLMITATFCGAGLALREGRLVALTVVPDLLPDSLARLLRWGIVAVMFAFMAVMGWLGVEFVQFGWNKETMATGIPRGIPYLAVPVGCALFLVHLAFFARRYVAQAFEHDAGYRPADEGR